MFSKTVEEEKSPWPSTDSVKVIEIQKNLTQNGSEARVTGREKLK